MIDLKLQRKNAESLAKVLREIRSRSEAYVVEFEKSKSYREGISILIKVLEEFK